MRLLTSFLALALVVSTHAYRPLQEYTSKVYPIPNQGQNGDPLFLTPYIEADDISGGQAAAKVTAPLPDVGDIFEEQYSGFITVDEVNNGNIFFWFFGATEVDPAQAPLVIWLQGGPGGSSMFGLLEIHGPIQAVFDDNGVTRAEINPWAWSRTANMLYIDQPVGTGYSFTDSDGLRTNIDDMGTDLYNFLQQWFTLFPQYQANDFYVFGESYAGKFVPEIGARIDVENQNSDNVFINLRGLGIGDGFMSPPDTSVQADFLYELGLVDQNQRDELRGIEDDIKTAVNSGNLVQAELLWSQDQAAYTSFIGCGYVYDATICQYPAEEDNYEEYMQYPETRQALHVGDLPFGQQSGAVFAANRGDFMAYGQDNVEYILNRYRTLIYDGNFDIICNHPGILKMFEKMETWTDIDAYYQTPRRAVSGDNGDTAGYLKQVGNLYMYVMRNAGHMVPRSQPKYAYEMFNNFLQDSF